MRQAKTTAGPDDRWEDFISKAGALSNISDRLSLLLSHSMFCYIGWMVQMTVMVIFIMIIIVLL
jgi:hypothetical protein